jgi:hypothetical protein
MSTQLWIEATCVRTLPPTVRPAAICKSATCKTFSETLQKCLLKVAYGHDERCYSVSYPLVRMTFPAEHDNAPINIQNHAPISAIHFQSSPRKVALHHTRDYPSQYRSPRRSGWWHISNFRMIDTIDQAPPSVLRYEYNVRHFYPSD